MPGPWPRGIIAIVLHKSISCVLFAVNVALFRPAVQFSTYRPAEASLAVDNDLSTRSCTNMDSTQPWLSIDLGTPMDVGRVCVINDANDYYGQLQLISVHQSHFISGRLVEKALGTVSMTRKFSKADKPAR